MSLPLLTAKGLSWAASGALFQAVLGIVSLAFLGRFISPADVGIAGATGAAVGIVDIVVSGALPDALRQRKDLADRHIDGTFICCQIISLLAVLFFAALATPIARILHAPGSEAVLIVTALGLPLGCAGAVPAALLARDLRFREDTRSRALSSLFGTLVSVALAVRGDGVWSLVIGDLARRLSGLLLASVYARWLPGTSGGPKAFLELARFNSQTLTLYLITSLETTLARLLIARLLGIEALGIYTMARKLLDALTAAVMSPFTTVVMPAAARSQDDPRATSALLETLYRLSALVVFPAFLGLAALAPVAVPLAFGQQWSSATVPIQMLMLVGLRSATGSINSSVLRGIGQTHLVLIMLLTGAVAQLMFIPVGAIWGVVGVCAAIVARTWLTWPLGAIFVRRAVGLGLRAQLSSGAPIVVPALGMGLVISVLRLALEAHLPPIALASLLVPTGAGVYVALIAMLSPDLFRSVLRIVAGLRRHDIESVEQGLLGKA